MTRGLGSMQWARSCVPTLQNRSWRATLLSWQPPLCHCERSVAISSPEESSLNSTRSPRRSAPRDDKMGTRESRRAGRRHRPLRSGTELRRPRHPAVDDSLRGRARGLTGNPAEDYRHHGAVLAPAMSSRLCVTFSTFPHPPLDNPIAIFVTCPALAPAPVWLQHGPTVRAAPHAYPLW